MGRPPNFPSNSPNRQWSAPAASGSILRNTVSLHANKVRQYRFNIPAVPNAVRKAVESTLASVKKPFAAQQNRIRVLTTKLHDQRQKAAAAQEKIAALERAKEEGLRDIRETRQQEMQNMVHTMEKKMRNRHSKEAAAAEQQWKEQMEEECEAKRDDFRKRAQEKSAQEPALKRLKLLEEAASQTTQEVSTTHPHEDAIAALIEPAMATVEVKSEVMQNEADAKTAALQQLEQSRRGMINLLKEVIKAEGKQKAKLTPPAKINTPSNRQA